jgi:hypothetical protein
MAAFALVLTVAAACDDDSTGPQPDPLTPESAAETMNDVVGAFFEGNDAVNSIMYFGDFVYGALGGGVPTAPIDMSAAATGPWQRHLLRSVQPLADVPANLPTEVLGTTFEWDEGLSQYVPSEATGAPANGVRFLMYAVNPITGVPESPLNEIGYLDIIDDSSFPPTIDVSMYIVIGGDTLIEVNATGLFGQTTATVTLTGYFSDGQEQLDFAMTATESYNPQTEDGMFSIGFSLTLGSFTASHTLTFVQTATDESITLEVELSDGTNDLLFILDLESTIDGLVVLAGSGVYWNDDQVAIISGTITEDTATITITNAEGDPLTAAEIQALGEVFELIEELGYFFEGLLYFTLDLVSIGATA